MFELETGSIEIQKSLFNRSRDYYGEITLVFVIVFRDGNTSNRNREEIYLYSELEIYLPLQRDRTCWGTTHWRSV